MHCSKKTDHKTSFFLNSLIHILILFSILTVFFLSYITSQEKRSYKREIRSILGQKLDEALEASTHKKELTVLLDKIDLGYFIKKYSSESECVKQNNEWISSLCFTVLFFLCVLVACLFLILYFSCRLCTNVMEIMTENITIFLFVGCIEVSFFLLIASKYIPVEPSLITNVMINNLKSKV